MQALQPRSTWLLFHFKEMYSFRMVSSYNCSRKLAFCVLLKNLSMFLSWRSYMWTEDKPQIVKCQKVHIGINFVPLPETYHLRFNPTISNVCLVLYQPWLLFVLIFPSVFWMFRRNLKYFCSYSIKSNPRAWLYGNYSS